MVIAIIGIISAFTYGLFHNMNKGQSVSRQVSVLSAVLERARSMTLSSESDSLYGVRVLSNQLVLFQGDTYSSTATTNQVYSIIPPVEITEYSLNGGGSDIIFNRLTGGTDNYGTITVAIPSTGASSTITIYATGLVETK